MFHGIRLLTSCLCLLLAAFSASGADAPQAEDPAKQYQLEFQTSRVTSREPFQVTLLTPGESRIKLVACVTDGGCITRETLTIGPMEKLVNDVTAVNLTYTLDGQPCKALFIRELKAAMRLPGPGVYRIKLWLHELYHDNGPVLIGEKEIRVES